MLWSARVRSRRFRFMSGKSDTVTDPGLTVTVPAEEESQNTDHEKESQSPTLLPKVCVTGDHQLENKMHDRCGRVLKSNLPSPSHTHAHHNRSYRFFRVSMCGLAVEARLYCARYSAIFEKGKGCASQVLARSIDSFEAIQSRFACEK